LPHAAILNFSTISAFLHPAFTTPLRVRGVMTSMRFGEALLRWFAGTLQKIHGLDMSKSIVRARPYH
jgi:hypothetical protein